MHEDKARMSEDVYLCCVVFSGDNGQSEVRSAGHWDNRGNRRLRFPCCGIHSRPRHLQVGLPVLRGG